MSYRITIRINSKTGEFETFQVDALEVTQARVPHNAAHEKVAADLGRLVERRPGVEEIPEVIAGLPNAAPYQPDLDEQQRRTRETEHEEGA